MWYFVKGEFVEESIAGKPIQEVMSWIETTIHPSLEMLENWIENKKAVGGVLAGERVGVFLLDASSHEEVGKMLRSLPFWGALKWTVAPIQSPHSAVEQDKEAFRRAREMMAQTGKH
jgi:hypothetical protein